jgi:hypothetical protein
LTVTALPFTEINLSNCAGSWRAAAINAGIK